MKFKQFLESKKTKPRPKNPKVYESKKDMEKDMNSYLYYITKGHNVLSESAVQMEFVDYLRMLNYDGIIIGDKEISFAEESKWVF